MATDRREFTELRNFVVHCHQEDKTLCESARILNISRSAIKCIIKILHQHGKISRGRECLCTNRDIDQLPKAAKLNRKHLYKALQIPSMRKRTILTA